MEIKWFLRRRRRCLVLLYGLFDSFFVVFDCGWCLLVGTLGKFFSDFYLFCDRGVHFLGFLLVVTTNNGKKVDFGFGYFQMFMGIRYYT